MYPAVDVTHETILIGPLTRDFIVQDGLRWSQPGCAVWHAGLALGLAAPDGVPGVEAVVVVYGTAGPWAAHAVVPALAAAGVRWRGVATPRETIFVNRYDPHRRRQMLISRADPLPLAALEGAAPAAAVVSPMPGDVPLGAVRMLRAQGAFVGADAQGLWRCGGPGGGSRRSRWTCGRR